jgi:hypothetical protein
MKTTKKATRKRTTTRPKSAKAPTGKVPRNKWFDAKKVRVRTTSKGPVIDIRK